MTISRRRLLGGAVVVAAGGAFGAYRTAFSSRWSDGQPKLRMPFPAGTVLLCEQGNLAKSGTHTLDKPQNTYAIDFSNMHEDEIIVVAAAGGRVAFVNAGSNVDDPNAGHQYGNQLRIEHAGGYSSFYAHLDAVDVAVSRTIETGERIGTMGRTGLAGGRHLHFSLHDTQWKGPGAKASVPITGMRASDCTAARVGPFRSYGGADFIAEYAVPWRGHLYASDNGAARDLDVVVARNAAALARALNARTTLASLARDWRDRSVDDVRTTLDAILAEDPDNPVASFYRAAAVLVPARRFDEARAALESAIRAAKVPRRFEPWIEAYAVAQLGVVAAETGRREESAALFARAQKALPSSPEIAAMISPYQ